VSGPVPGPVAAAADLLLEATIVGSFSRVGYQARRVLAGWTDPDTTALAGRVALVTGATSGIGRAVAEGLARAGATVVILGRDRERTEAARAAIEQAADRGSGAVDVVVGDLSHLHDVRRVAREIGRSHHRLDAVVHNAGALVHDHRITQDGIELTAQTHVVAPFLLTSLLLPTLAATPESRVIHVVSGGLYTTRLSVEALAHADPADFDGVRAYARAKRASLVLAGEWSARARGVTVHAMHPGWVDTAGLQTSLPAFHRVARPLLRTAAQGADTAVWLATSAESGRPGGRLWLDRRPRGTHYRPGTADPPGEAGRLWAWCVERAGVDDPAVVEVG
jgi:dehydrogenase/reductase SDR family member 12